MFIAVELTVWMMRQPVGWLHLSAHLMPDTACNSRAVANCTLLSCGAKEAPKPTNAALRVWPRQRPANYLQKLCVLECGLCSCSCYTMIYLQGAAVAVLQLWLRCHWCSQAGRLLQPCWKALCCKLQTNCFCLHTPEHESQHPAKHQQ